jgi:hypothetical protein
VCNVLDWEFGKEKKRSGDLLIPNFFKEESLYFKLNEALRSSNRALMKPYLPYLKLFLSGLALLPGYQSATQSLWRGVRGDIANLFDLKKKYW